MLCPKVGAEPSISSCSSPWGVTQVVNVAARTVVERLTTTVEQHLLGIHVLAGDVLQAVPELGASEKIILANPLADLRKPPPVRREVLIPDDAYGRMMDDDL